VVQEGSTLTRTPDGDADLGYWRSRPLWWVLSGLLALAAAAAYGVTVYAESGTSCPGLLHRYDPLAASRLSQCAPFYEKRTREVVAVAILALLAVARALTLHRTTPHRNLEKAGPKASGGDLMASLAIGVGVAALGYIPVAALTVIFITGVTQSFYGVEAAWEPLGNVLAIVVAAIFIGRRTAVTGRTALAAASIAVPAWALLRVGGTELLETERAGVGLNPNGSVNALLVVVAVLPLVLSVTALALAESRGRRLASRLLSVVLILLSAAVTELVLIDELRPGYSPKLGPGEENLLSTRAALTLLATPLILSLAVTASVLSRRDRADSTRSTS